MTAAPTSLVRLARLFGIAPSYWANSGERRAIAGETLQAVVDEALGTQPADGVQVELADGLRALGCELRAGTPAPRFVPRATST